MIKIVSWIVAVVSFGLLLGLIAGLALLAGAEGSQVLTAYLSSVATVGALYGYAVVNTEV